MVSGLVSVIRKLAALVVLAGVLYLAVGQVSAANEVFSPPAQDPPYPTNTHPPMPTPYPTAEDTQAPPTFAGPTPTQPQQATLTPTGLGSATPQTTSTTGPIRVTATTTTRVTQPTQAAATRTPILGDTPTLEPLPELDLLFPNIDPPTPSPTPDLTEAAGEVGVVSIISDVPPAVSVLGVIVVLIWGLLGVFLAAYLKRLGY